MENFDYQILPQDEVSEPSQAQKESRARFGRLTWFLSGHAKTANLSKERERDLIAEAQAGSREAVQELTCRYSGFLDKIARRIASQTNIPEMHDDLFALAMQCMHRSIMKMNVAEHDARLSTFARYHVVGELMRFANNNKLPFSTLTSMHEKRAFYRYAQIKREFKEVHGRSLQDCLSDYKLAEEITGTPATAIQRAFMARKTKTIPLHRIEIVANGSSPEELASKNDNKNLVNEALFAIKPQLNDRDFDIISQYAKNVDMRPNDLAETYAITPTRVLQINRNCQRMMREYLAEKGINRHSDLA